MSFLRLTRESEITGMLGLMGTVLTRRSSIYVSSPITSGRRLLAWHSTPGVVTFDRRFKQEVLEPNLAVARAAVATIRANTHMPVIDPTALPALDGWTQDDYRFLWGRVIELFAHEVVFLDGWEFSSGCTYEYLIATREDLPAKSLEGSRIRLVDAIKSIRDGRNQLESVGSDITFINSVLIKLEQLLSGSAEDGGARVQR